MELFFDVYPFPMNFLQNDLHAELARIPGEYKELFIEKSRQIGVRIVNGRSEPVSFSETAGVSLLLTNGKNRFFEARESLEEIIPLFERA